MRASTSLLKFIVGIGLLAAWGTAAPAAVLTVEVEVPPASITVERAAEGARFSIDGHEGYRLQEPGRPDLPFRVVEVLLPQGETVSDYEIGRTGRAVVAAGISAAVAPAMTTVEGVPGVGDPLAEGTDTFPRRAGRLLGVSTYHGYAIASFVLYPVAIAGDDAVAWSRVTVRVETEPAAPDAVAERLRYRDGFRDGVAREVAARVLNPEAVGSYAFSETRVPDAPGGFQPTSYPSLEGSPVDYVIITNDSLAAAYQELADWKTEKGVPTVVRTTEWIAANYRNGVDIQETIRNFVVDAYAKWGITYVLLGGDTEEIPARLAWSAFYDGGRLLPVDMYFACLDGDWNADGDAVFGEALGDDADLYAEVFNGRLPTSSVAEVNLLVGKIKAYETPNDRSYTNRVLHAAEVLFPLGWDHGQPITQNGADFAETVRINTMLDPELDVVRMYETDYFFFGAVAETKAAVIDSVNTGFNFLNHVGHGFRFNMSVGDGSLQNADADAFTNGDRLTNVYMLNCTAVAYTYYCHAEHWMRNPNGGAVTCIGANESAFPNAASFYMNAFWDLVFNDDVVHVGETFARSRESRTLLAALGENVDRWTHYIYTFLGDPEMSLWNGPVDTLQVSHPASVSPGTTPITVTVLDGDGLPVDSAMVCLSKDDDDYQVGTTDGAGQVTLEFRAESPGSITVVATGRNHARHESAITVSAELDAYVRLGGMTIDDDDTGATSGNGDGVVDAGETIEWTIELENTGLAASGNVDLVLRSSDGGVTIEDSTASVGIIGAGGNVAAGDPVRVAFSSSITDETVVDFTLVIKEGGVDTWTDGFSKVVHAPALSMVKVRIDDTASGDGDGVVDAGEEFRLYYELKNFGTGATTPLTAAIQDLDDGFLFTDSTDAYVAIPKVTSAENTAGFLLEEGSVATANRLELTVTDGYGRAYVDTLELRPPLPPSNLVFDPKLGVDRLEVSWDPSPSPDVDRYNLYRSDTPGPPYTQVNVDPVDFTVFLDTGLLASTAYYYVATAIDSSGNESAPSAEYSGSTNPAQIEGWPIQVKVETTSSPVVGDIDGDGDEEIVVGDNYVYAWHHNGVELIDGDGDPQSWGILSTRGDTFVGHLALARIDAQPGLDIVAPSRVTREVFVFNAVGDTIPGWPRPVENAIRAGVAIADLDGDGLNEVIAVDEGGVLYAWHANGDEVVDGDNNPGSLGVIRRLPGCSFQYSGPAIADMDGDEDDEIIIGTQGDSVYVIDGDGSLLPGWPYGLASDVTGSVAVGDIDNDGDLEVVVSESLGGLTALHHDGTVKWSLWFANGLFFGPSPALGDMNGNGHLETLIPSSNGNLYLIRSNGNSLPGWPVEYSDFTYTESSPVIADMDGDGSPDVILGDETQFVKAWDINGNIIPGFPLATGDAMRGVPSVSDLEGDGDVDLIAAGWDKSVYVWDFNSLWDADASPWRGYHANVHNTGYIETVIATGIRDVAFTFAVRGGALELSWILPPDAGALFDIERARVGAGEPEESWSWSRVASELAVDLDGRLAFRDGGVDAGTRYVYRVTARETGVGSFTSQEVYIPVARAQLGQNYPNPFNPVTRISYLVPDGPARAVSLIVYDVRGARVRTLVNNTVSGGRHVAEWDGRNDAGESVGSGVYFYRMVSGSFAQTRKMVLLK